MIRNIIIFTILVNRLAWLGPVLGGDPITPGLGFLEWLGSFGVEGVLMIALFGLLGSVLYLKQRGQSKTQPALITEL